jgi:hypothetical protein
LGDRDRRIEGFARVIGCDGENLAVCGVTDCHTVPMGNDSLDIAALDGMKRCGGPPAGRLFPPHMDAAVIALVGYNFSRWCTGYEGSIARGRKGIRGNQCLLHRQVEQRYGTGQPYGNKQHTNRNGNSSLPHGSPHPPILFWSIVQCICQKPRRICQKNNLQTP